MKIIVKHPSGLEYKSKELDYTETKLKSILDKNDNYFVVEGDEHNYILMRNFVLDCAIVVIK